MPPNNRNRNAEDYQNEDTIVVKTDNYWAQVSSPDSSPDPEGPEPIVASLLAQIAKARMEGEGEEQELESPEPEQENEDQLPGYSAVESERNARQSSQSASRSARIPKVTGNTSEDKLNAMPKLRELPVSFLFTLCYFSICEGIRLVWRGCWIYKHFHQITLY